MKYVCVCVCECVCGGGGVAGRYVDKVGARNGEERECAQSCGVEAK